MFRSSLARLSVGLRAFSGVARTSTPLFHIQPRLVAITQTLSRLQTIQFPQSWTQPKMAEAPEGDAVEADAAEDNAIYMDSVLRKRRLKMKKHKLRKRRRNQRALKKRLGKI